MTAPQGIMAFGKPLPFISASFTLSHGTQPSLGAIYLPPLPNFKLPQIGDLTISFAKNRITFKECLWRRMTLQNQDDGSTQFGIEFRDFRWKWALDSISGFYNVTLGDRVKTIRSSTEMKPQDLFKLCFTALKIPDRDVDVSKVPNDMRPEIAWEYTRIDHALDELCRLTGCRVVPLSGNKIRVIPQGVGSPLPVLPYTNYSAELEPAFYPDSIDVVGARIIRDFDIPLQPMAKEINGNIVPLDKASYTPKDGWPTADILFFGGLNTKAMESAVAAAQESVYRYWAPVLPFKLPATKNLPEVEINSIDQILPLLDHQVATQSINRAITAAGGERETIVTEKPAELWGEYYNHSTGASSVLDVENPDRADTVGIPTIEPGVNLERYPHLRVNGYQIDRERGLILTDEQLYLYRFELWEIDGLQKRGTPLSELEILSQAKIHARLFLRCAVQYREEETRAWIHSVKSEKLRRKPLGIGAHIVQRDDIGLRAKMEWTGIGKTMRYTDNEEEWNNRAGYYLEAAKALIKPEQAESANYCTLVDIPLDGARQQITWYISEDGFCFTRVSRNREESFIVPSYEQRLALAQLKQVLEAKQKAAGEPKK